MEATHDSRGGRRVVIFAPPGAFSLDVLGSYEIFFAASGLLAQRARPEIANFDDFRADEMPYRIELAADRAGPLQTLSGARLVADVALNDVRGPLDTLVVAGGDVTQIHAAFSARPELREALRRVAQRARRVASVCTGAFALAAAGLLDHRKATTHWAACDLLQAQFAKVRVERGPIAVRDGNIYTSAGATTGMDLTLGFVRDDYGSEIAREVARWLVLYIERSPSQQQFSTSLRGVGTESKSLRDLQRYILEHVRDDLSLQSLAKRVGASVRSFSRAFKREFATTPASYVEAVRVDAAVRKLELGEASLASIADQVGFGSVDTLRRAFVRQRGEVPSQLRARKLDAPVATRQRTQAASRPRHRRKTSIAS